MYSVWKDTKCISVLSTKHPGHSENKVQRNTKDSEGHHCKKDVPIPETVYHYNRYMGGVDRSDQLIKYYNVLRQTKRYWKTLFFHFIDVAVVNAYILHKECTLNPLSHYEFRENLVRSLCCTATPDYSILVGKRQQSTASINVDHRLVRMKTMRQCVYCSLVHKEKHRTTRQCAECEVPLCFQSRDCFTKWHGRRFAQTREAWLARPEREMPRGCPKGSTVPKGRGKRKRKNW